MKKLELAILMLLCIISCNNPSRENIQKFSPVDKVLFEIINREDSLLFAAFNERNFELFRTYFSEDLEIYQDNIGIRNYSQSMNAFKDLFEKDYILTRNLIRESLEVYPIKDYGAIEVGRHSFCHTENGKQECGVFKFSHVWKLENGKWKITRILTYDHNN